MHEKSRFALRVGDREVPLPLGDFQIGRNSACHLVLDDGMVSRCHAVLHVSAHEVTIEDQGSRNGVLVNGMRLRQPKPLQHGERITIGSYDLVLFETIRQRNERRPTNPLLGRGAGGRARRERITPQQGEPRSVYDALVRSCERALAEGRMQDVQSSARNLRASVRGGLVQTSPPDVPTLRHLTEFALHVAEVAGDREWLTCLFDVQGAAGRVFDEKTIARLCSLAEQQSFVGCTAVRTYVRRLRKASHQLTDDERERLHRIAQLVGEED